MPSLLVVDDERVVTRDLEENLLQMSYEVAGVASSGEEAIEKARTLRPDLVLMNIVMPGEKDGIAAAEEIRAELNIPVVFLTAYADLELLKRAKSALPFGYIVKPFQSHQLQATIEMALHKSQLEKLLSESVEAQRAAIRQLQRDITERKRAEEELKTAHEELEQAYDTLEQTQAAAIAAEKLAALGRLTAGVSHEVLNPLTAINLVLQRLLDDPDIDPSLAEDLRGIEEQADRIAKISQGLLSFARQRPVERRRFDFNETVRRTLDLVSHELSLRAVEVELRLAEGLPPILADEDQIQQVILNLLTNAHDAMPEGGRLVLHTEAVRDDGRQFVELRVEDTGEGIDPDHLGKLFDPFFTTKGEGEGTGLGLSICQGIIEAHGGAIRAKNLPEGGTSFIIRLGIGEE